MTTRVLLYLRRSRIGHLLVALPVLRAVRRHFGPEAELWLPHRPGEPTSPKDLFQLGVEVDGFIPWPAGRGPGAACALVARLWRQRFTCAVFADSSGLPARWLRRDQLLLRAGGIRQFIGFHPLTAQTQLLHPGAGRERLKQEALCRLDNLARDGLNTQLESDFSAPLLVPPAAEQAAAQAWLQARRRHPERALVAIGPGTREAANAWPMERFLELGQRLLALGQVELLVCGGPAEQAAGEQLIAAWGQGLNAAGAFSVLGSAALLQACRFLVGLDTGSTHLAAAVGTPCVVLQGGRVAAGLWDPLGPGHCVLRYPVACCGCQLGVCPFSRHPCMRGISVEAVWAAILGLRARLDHAS